ncbi:MAG: hypothetical protein HUK14_08295 [Muribaculaceae bacterium]|nr:hypothetical protein [Muribaculaceae bacterium]
MKNFISILCALPLVLLCSLSSSCSGDKNEAEGIINQAKELIDAKQIDEARELCGTLQAMPEKMSAKDYSALALLYMQLVEYSDNIDDINSAITAYNSAIGLDEKETQAYFSGVTDSDGQRRIMLLFSLSGALQTPDEIVPIDSIPANSNNDESLN